MDYNAIMQRAVQLALKGKYQTDPNPMVGAVLVDSNGKTLSEGFHQKAGQPHAEVNALESFEKVPQDATLFVTLEPCCFHGKTPACTELLIKKEVKQVVIGTLDPNPLVSGKGVKTLQDHGITVISGVLEKECQEINRIFNKHIITNRPYIALKAAASLDGKIAMPSGESKWITGEPARAEGHLLRSHYQAIIVGANTMRQDNPKLTDRTSSNPRNPIKILFTSQGEIPCKSDFIHDESTARIIFAGTQCPVEKVKGYRDIGIEVYVDDHEIPSPDWALSIMHSKGIYSALVEGGGKLIASFVRQKLADRLYLFLSGKIIGDSKAPGWCDYLGIEHLANVPRLSMTDMRKIGNDVLVIADFINETKEK